MSGIMHVDESVFKRELIFNTRSISAQSNDKTLSLIYSIYLSTAVRYFYKHHLVVIVKIQIVAVELVNKYNQTI